MNHLKIFVVLSVFQRFFMRSALPLMVIVIAVTAVVGPTASASTIRSINDLYDSPLLTAGESLHLRFWFDDAATATDRQSADMVFINWGSYSRDVSGVSTSLYFGKQLIGTTTTSWPGATGFFVTPDSAFGSVGALRKTVVDRDVLGKILSGAEAELVVAPHFTSLDGYIAFSGWGIQSAMGLGAGNFTPIYPSARLVRAASVEVAEPAGAALFFSLLFCLLLLHQRRRALGALCPE